MMKYRIADGIALADVAYFIYGRTIEELFVNAACAVTQTMVEPVTINPLQNFKFQISNFKLDDLLLDFLNELLFYKDSQGLLFSKFKIKIIEKEKSGGKTQFVLKIEVWGEKIDIKKHKLRCDVKAVTRHKFSLRKKNDKYIALLVLDI